MIYNSMLELVGNTPIVKLNKIKEFYNLPANLYVKLEMFNAAGSIKSRIAKAIIVNAINKAMIHVDGSLYETETAEEIADIIAREGKDMTVEYIQDRVEEELMKNANLRCLKIPRRSSLPCFFHTWKKPFDQRRRCL